MPKRTDIHKVLIIGSGPIIIGQACHAWRKIYGGKNEEI